MTRLRPALALLAVAASAAAQSPATTTAPVRRAHHSLVYDDSRGQVLLFGGSSPRGDGGCCDMFNDLWAFDGTRWTPLPSSGEPMSGSTLAYDTRAKRIVGLGGYNGSSMAIMRTLESDGWRVSRSGAPMVAAEPGFVYDSRRNRFVAFGGSSGRGMVNGDTWELDGATWTKLTVASPPARHALGMVFDEKRGRVVMFGGGTPGSAGNPPRQLGDTWEFDGTAWTQRSETGPSARMSPGITYDSKRGLVILFGGMGATGFLGDTWSWDGAKWTKLADTGPEPRAMGYLAYDKKRDRVVLFGGRKGWPNDANDTWEWDGSSWRRVAN